MPTTTNFGWSTPADTDLVKDGALAIRTLGNGVDTSMAQLKGGTTGQVLSKTSNTDMAFTWTTPSTSITFVGCSLYNTTNTTISNATQTTLLFDSEYIDTDGFHSTTTNTGRITIPTGKGGKYLFVLQNYFDDAANGYKRSELFKNNALLEKAIFTISGTGYNSITQSYITTAVAGDYFTFVISQTSGGNVTNYHAGTFFQCQYLGA
jgi:hypothetical protein